LGVSLTFACLEYDDFCLSKIITVFFFIYIARQPLVVQGLVIVDVPRTHSDTPLSVGLPMVSDQPTQ
jgi:hypothetical protein